MRTADVDRLRRATEQRRGGHQQPVVGPDEDPIAGADRDRAALGPNPRVDDREMHAAGRGERHRPAQRQGAAAHVVARDACVRSITRTSGATVAMTAWQTPTNSSSRP